jgi:uncharacterized protein (DUF885 family)
MHEIHSLADRMVDEAAAATPVDATYAGVPGYDDRWDDYSLAGSEAVRDLIVGHLARVRALPDAVDAWDRLAVGVISEALESELARYDIDEHLRDLNSISSPLQDVREVFEHMDTGSAEGRDAVVARLETLPAAVAGYRDRLTAGIRRGVTAARRQIEEAVRQCRHAAGDGSSFDALPVRFQAAVPDEADLIARVAAGSAAAKAAYADLGEFLEREYLPAAAERDGVGEERYVHLARRFLGRSLDPRATYEWGWSEVSRLRAAMEELGEEIVAGAALPEVLGVLQTDPERASASAEGFRRQMEERQEIALRELDGSHFDVPDPIKRIDVKLAPPGGSLGAFYVPPTEDFTRDGCVWFAIGERRAVPLFDQVSTAYHEGFPGHHLQAGLQMAASGRTTRYHRLWVWYPGVGEGWALYAEDLMEELGYLERPDYVMGKLASEMLRACRVVIDIGSHLELPIPRDQPFHPGESWSFETGVEMLVDYAAQDRGVAVSEMNRYLGWPGQAIAYKVGQQAIRDLRAERRTRLGAEFDQKAFHHRLLEVGAVGLDTLESWMRAG